MSDSYGSFMSNFMNLMLSYYQMEEGSQGSYQAQLDQIAAVLKDINNVIAEINGAGGMTAAQALQLAADMDKLKTFIDSANFLSAGQKQQFEQSIDQNFWNLSVTVGGTTQTLQQWLEADPTGQQLATALQTASQQPGGLSQLLAAIQQLTSISQEQNRVANELQLVVDMMKTILQTMQYQLQQNQELVNKAQQIPR
jgi:hypothetical protein